MVPAAPAPSRRHPQALPSLMAWLQDHIPELDAVVLDVDGVLMTARRPAPGARELLDWLRRTQTPFSLMTNDGCQSPAEKAERLRACGLAFHAGEIVSSGHCIAELAERRGWSGQRFFAMGEVGSPCYAEAAGLQVTRAPASLHECIGVIVGEKKYAWEEVVTDVLNFLVRTPRAPLVVPNPDIFFPGPAGRVRLASGAVTRLLVELCREYGFELRPVFLGKPFSPIFTYNLQHLQEQAGKQMDATRILMVGDSLPADIRGGNEFGHRTALVMTGLTSPELLAQSETVPELVFNCI